MIKGKIILEDKREMHFELYEDIAPISVDNFVQLAKSGFYKGTIFHRIIPAFMNQAGGYYIQDNQLKEKKSQSIQGEFAENGFENSLHHELGVLSMARSQDKNSASSQFFLCVDNCQHLDGHYAAFGKIVDEESLKILKSLNKVKTTFLNYMFADFPVKPIIIQNIEIEENV